MKQMFDKSGGIPMRIRKGRIILFIILMAVALLISGGLFAKSRSVVDANDGREKRFTSIQVKKGDSLWSIAKEHISDEYESLDQYIDEVCETNHIYDRMITEDMYLVIPYYTDIE